MNTMSDNDAKISTNHYCFFRLVFFFIKFYYSILLVLTVTLIRTRQKMPNEDKANLNNVGVYFHIAELAISKTAMEISKRLT